MYIQVNVTKDEYIQVENKAKDKHLSLSAMARTLIFEGLKHE
jgi:hypothetical protein